MNKKISLLFTILVLFPLTCCSAEKTQKKPSQVSKTEQSATNSRILVTFIELGADKCVPCKMMKPVMEKVETDYAGIVKVVFYDVWKPEGRPAAQKYQIRLIPTQVFLDENGKEFFRHEGFLPFESIAELLTKRGIKPISLKEGSSGG